MSVKYRIYTIVEVSLCFELEAESVEEAKREAEEMSRKCIKVGGAGFTRTVCVQEMEGDTVIGTIE